MDLDPQHALQYVVGDLRPLVTDFRFPAAILLILFAAVRPRAGVTRCIILGRVLAIMAAILFIASVWSPLAPLAEVGGWIAFASLFSSHVCDGALRWREILWAVRVAEPGPEARIWRAHRVLRSMRVERENAQ